MAFIVGYVSKKERAILEERGWEVEDASEYGLVGEEKHHLVSPPPHDDEVVVIFVDADVLSVMNGPLRPDWEQ